MVDSLGSNFDYSHDVLSCSPEFPHKLEPQCPESSSAGLVTHRLLPFPLLVLVFLILLE